MHGVHTMVTAPLNSAWRRPIGEIRPHLQVKDRARRCLSQCCDKPELPKCDVAQIIAEQND